LLEGASGAKPDEFGGTLLVGRHHARHQAGHQGGNFFTIYNDIGRVTMALALKDPGAPGVTNVPSALNAVTFTHYRVDFRRTDGRNVQGSDVPYAFESGLTFSVPPDGTVQIGFDIVNTPRNRRRRSRRWSPTLTSSIPSRRDVLRERHGREERHCAGLDGHFVRKLRGSH